MRKISQLTTIGINPKYSSDKIKISETFAQIQRLQPSQIRSIYCTPYNSEPRDMRINESIPFP